MKVTFGPHRSTAYVDTAYCFGPCSEGWRSVCLSVTVMNCAKTAEPIEMPFGLRTGVGPRNRVMN